MALATEILAARVEEAVGFLENLPDDLSGVYQWHHFINELYPRLHLASFTRMDVALECLDKVLFNNAFVKSCLTIKYKRQEEVWTLGNGQVGGLGATEMYSDGSYLLSICVDGHENGTPWEILETLLHEMCHVFTMMILGNASEHHGKQWQILAMAVEREMTRLMGDRVKLGRRFAARYDVKQEKCPHFSTEEIELFFESSDPRNKEKLRCDCFSTTDVANGCNPDATSGDPTAESGNDWTNPIIIGD
ncbi:uncharacterized protein RCC_08021 [Ramularia collo-cygni]|uniref:SprT-like domain-containing protein n=1 Tax=Ramularia collo-cygni TaxID=112498 RepID=A0A2D3UWF9_9PEZI|nr:uncharacterized protein RCC_08021 [Ramularia collo-cygni]CZT22152.1 uncharacterized protein RCC_08021 [Ramularia collo-cygni]